MLKNIISFMNLAGFALITVMPFASIADDDCMTPTVECLATLVVTLQQQIGALEITLQAQQEELQAQQTQIQAQQKRIQALEYAHPFPQEAGIPEQRLQALERSHQLPKPAIVIDSIEHVKGDIKIDHLKAEHLKAKTLEADKITFTSKGKMLALANQIDHLKAQLRVIETAPQTVTSKAGIKLPGDVFRDRLKDASVGPEMVVIPAGRFRMGDIQGDGSDSEKPVHQVFVAPFAMGRYEVTFAEYDKFAQATGRDKPKDGGWGRGNRPVIHVSMDDATAYGVWLSQQTGKQYRLPTEAEWEYAARAGTTTKYWWGKKIGSNRTNCTSSGSQWSGKQTAPVGSFAPNPFGLYDMMGNVWEWSADPWHKNYQDAPIDGGVWEEGGNPSYRVIRGGSWIFPCTAAGRLSVQSTSSAHFIGFRVVAVVAVAWTTH
jgi:formylglycine-generating enzyme required for sulfatase activity